MFYNRAKGCTTALIKPRKSANSNSLAGTAFYNTLPNSATQMALGIILIH